MFCHLYQTVQELVFLVKFKKNWDIVIKMKPKKNNKYRVQDMGL